MDNFESGERYVNKKDLHKKILEAPRLIFKCDIYKAIRKGEVVY